MILKPTYTYPGLFYFIVDHRSGPWGRASCLYVVDDFGNAVRPNVFQWDYTLPLDGEYYD